MRKITPETLELTQQMLREPILLLERVTASGEPAAIPYLMPLGLSGDGRLRRRAREGIAALYGLLPVEQLPELDERLRSAWQGLIDWHGIKPAAVVDVELRSEADAIYAGLLASHRSGYVRAEALRLLRGRATAAAVPFVLVRLTDWVDPVRQQALLCAQACLKPENAAAVVASLPLLERLQGLVRWFHVPGKRIGEVLRSGAAVDALREGWASPKRGMRRLCFRHAAGNPVFALAEVLEKAAADGDALIRHWAYKTGGMGRFLEQAAADDYAPNRWLSFEAVSADADRLPPFLFDRAGAIRRECQRLLADRFGVAVAEIYRGALEQDVAILGLGETGTDADVPLVMERLRSPKARVRRAAVQSLFLLDGAGHRETFLRVIATDTPAVAGQATSAVLAERDLLVPLIWDAAKQNPSASARWSVLRLLREKWKWWLLAVYLDAACDEDARIQTLAKQLLESWSRRFARSFLAPTSAERAALAELRTLKRVPTSWQSVVDRALSE